MITRGFIANALSVTYAQSVSIWYWQQYLVPQLTTANCTAVQVSTVVSVLGQILETVSHKSDVAIVDAPTAQRMGRVLQGMQVCGLTTCSPLQPHFAHHATYCWESLRLAGNGWAKFVLEIWRTCKGFRAESVCHARAFGTRHMRMMHILPPLEQAALATFVNCCSNPRPIKHPLLRSHRRRCLHQ